MSRNVSKLLWGIRIFRFIESNKIFIPYMVKASALLATPYLISEACGYRDTESIKFSLQLGASFAAYIPLLKQVLAS